MSMNHASEEVFLVTAKCGDQMLFASCNYIGLRICLGSPFTNRNIYLYALCTYLGWLYDYPAAYAYSIFLAGG